MHGTYKSAHDMRHDQAYKSDHAADRNDHAGQDCGGQNDQQFDASGVSSQCLCHIITKQQHIQLPGN